jgi:hypothetical protein
MPDGSCAGLVGTNTIRQGDSRVASLDYIVDNGGVIFDAVSTQPWSGDAQVSVSIVNWRKGADVMPKSLWLTDGTTRLEVDEIGPSLSAAVDLRTAADLLANKVPKVHFQGQTPGITAGFVLSPEEAADLRRRDSGAAGVLFPYLVGNELLHDFAPSRVVIDFDSDDAMSAQASSPAAYERLRATVLPERQRAAAEQESANATVRASRPNARTNNHHAGFLNQWWKHSYRRTDMLAAIRRSDRYIALSRVSSEQRHSVFTFVASSINPSDAVQVFALDDDYSFGILQSGLHRLWFEERCSTFETRLRYTSKMVFNSFPWPQAPDELAVRRVSDASAALLEFRQARLTAGITLGRQYDSLRQPGRSELRDLHEALDRAVLLAYGFEDDDDLLTQLLALNRSCAELEEEGGEVRGPGCRGLAGARSSNHAMQPA